MAWAAALGMAPSTAGRDTFIVGLSSQSSDSGVWCVLRVDPGLWHRL